METLPYGSWPSTLTAARISSGARKIRDLFWDRGTLYWVEALPEKGGQQRLFAHDGGVKSVGPDASVRTRVHEYGGGAATAAEGTLYWSRDEDQRWYSSSGGSQPLSPEGWRFADALVDSRRSRLIAVGEKDGKNCLGAFSLRGGGFRPLAEGHDFYSSPRLSPDGHTLAWLAWDHPLMPWEGAQLWVAALQADGSLGEPRHVAGGGSEAVVHPQWSPGGALYFISDRTGWQNLYRVTPGGSEPLCPLPRDFGEPLWVFGLSTYGFIDENTLIATYREEGTSQLCSLHTETGTLTPISTPYTDIQYLKCSNGEIAFVGASPSRAPEVIRGAPGRLTPVRGPDAPESWQISAPEAITFPGWKGLPCHGYLYRPSSPTHRGPQGTKPPVIVTLHGGPTAATSSALNLNIQYWTSRGFCVFDLNYSGSTGFGRPYWERLRGTWGIADVGDAATAVDFLRGEGLAEQALIRGGSAGGYTTLCALTFTDRFQAGASYFGVSDLKALVADTHKFESQYDRFLLGDYDDRLLAERSPLTHRHQLKRPVLFLQGDEDRVVPPNQSEMMYQALKQQGVLTGYLLFSGEGHGFRRPESQQRALEAEWYFYGRALGFDAPAPVPPLQLDNDRN